MKTRVMVRFFIMALGLVLFFTFICEAKAKEPKTSEILEQGIGQYKHENYDEAIIFLEKARQEDPKSTLAAYYLGLTYKKLQDYKQAVIPLQDAVTFSPKIKGALIELIDCFYQLGRLEEAKKWIAEAEKEGIRPAQVAFLKGLVFLKEDDVTNAVDSFEKAKALDSSMSQACDYQIGIAYLKERKFTDAKEAFRGVVIFDPASNMANFANQYIDALTKREVLLKPFRLTFSGAWQYDDNVVLLPSDDSLATNISDKGDSRYVFRANGEYNKRFSDLFVLKSQYLFYYGKQNDLGFYDTMTNNVAVQPNFYFNNSNLSFPLGYTHTMVNHKSYLSNPSLISIYNFMKGNSNMGQLFVKYQYKDYFWMPSTADEDRDSNDVGGGFGWFFFFAKNKGFLNFKYALNREFTKGNNWDYLGNRVTATFLAPVSDKLNLTVCGDIYWQNFLNTHTIYNVHRRDVVYTISSLLAYKFYKDCEFQFQYTFIKDHSDIGIYDYHRNIYNLGIEVKF